MEEEKYYLVAFVQTPVGKFVGRAHKKASPKNIICQFRDQWEDNCDTHVRAVLFSLTDDEVEICFPSEVWRHSVVTFQIIREENDWKT